MNTFILLSGFGPKKIKHTTKDILLNALWHTFYGELSSNSFFTVESVPESNDLNDCKAKGNTRIHMWKMPATSLNSPTSGAELFVFYIASSKSNDMYGTQIALAAYRNNIFIRLYADKEWDDWKSI